MLDASISYNRYKFIGYEFLTWLWFIIETSPEKLAILNEESSSLEIGNRIVLENRVNDASESILIKGDDAEFQEGFTAMEKGAVVTELNLCYKFQDQEWRFTIKGESLHIVSLKTPITAAPEKREDIEGAVLEKVFLIEKATQVIEQIFGNFIRLRISDKWTKDTVPLIKHWIFS